MTRTIEEIRQLVQAHGSAGLTDRQLLERFAAEKDEAAFAQLVRRHGPMVLQVCLRVLRNRHDAEDAFQAAFLVLARKAASVRWLDSARGWIFQVAHRLALKMRTASQRMRTCPLAEAAAPTTGNDQAEWELRAILDEELSRLPEKYRTALLLCCCEGMTRAEAARELGWKEGTVKIRLERGRELLRTRLTRRGLALSCFLGSTSLAVTAELVDATASSARLFALGQVTAVSAASKPSALAAGVLRTMMMTKLKIAALLALAVLAVTIGVGLGAYVPFALDQDEAARPLLPKPRAGTAEPPAKAEEKPLRVLLFAGGATREYQFVRALFVRQMEKKQAELSICLQSAGPGTIQDVLPERLHKQFPTRLTAAEKDDDADRFNNLAAYDVVIAFDPDWTQLTEEQARLLEQWVGKMGRGLIVVAGQLNTPLLAQPGVKAKKLDPILKLLPVQLADSREPDAIRDTSKPWPLRFSGAEKYLKLDEAGKDSLAGWAEFFYGKHRDDWQKTKDQPERGFYAVYPVKSVKRTAAVVAAYRDPAALIDAEDNKFQYMPYLAAMPYGKGKSIYLGSGETWRLREYSSAFHERFWTQLARHAASMGKP